METYKATMQREIRKMWICAGVLLAMFGVLSILTGSAVFVVVYVPIIFLYIWRWYRRETKYVNEFVQCKNVEIREVMDDVYSGKALGTTLIGEKYIMTFFQRRRLLAYEDVMWVYKTCNSNAIESWNVVFVVGALDRIETVTSSEMEADWIINRVMQKCPYVLQGFTKELNHTFIHDFSAFRYVVEQRKSANLKPSEV